MGSDRPIKFNGELKGFQVKDPVPKQSKEQQLPYNICTRCAMPLGAGPKSKIIRCKCGEFMIFTNEIWAEYVSPLDVRVASAGMPPIKLH